MILRDMLRHEPLAKVLLYSDQFYNFPQYIEDTTFGISCDAFTNFKETLTRHKPMVAVYLDNSYDRVCFFSTSATVVFNMASYHPHTVLCNVYDTHLVNQLRYEATITQAPWRNSSGQSELQRHDPLHCERSQPQADNEPPPRQEPQHPV